MVYDMTQNHLVPPQNIAVGRYYLQDLHNVENQDYAAFDFDKRYQARMACETPPPSQTLPQPPPTPAPRRRTRKNLCRILEGSILIINMF
uniref:Uncharacterized protein n=1 Tax=Stomoxys calcitrans TaxID=35570 RepID=A0A1I8PQA9_STOCA